MTPPMMAPMGAEGFASETLGIGGVVKIAPPLVDLPLAVSVPLSVFEAEARVRERPALVVLEVKVDVASSRRSSKSDERRASQVAVGDSPSYVVSKTWKALVVTESQE